MLALLFIFCSLVTLDHVRTILRDRQVAGVSLLPSYVFITTNLFEVYYFGRLGDWWTVTGAILMAISNLTWLGLVLHFKRNSNAQFAG